MEIVIRRQNIKLLRAIAELDALLFEVPFNSLVGTYGEYFEEWKKVDGTRTFTAHLSENDFVGRLSIDCNGKLKACINFEIQGRNNVVISIVLY